jgi:hypothetical protein
MPGYWPASMRFFSASTFAPPAMLRSFASDESVTRRSM